MRVMKLDQALESKRISRHYRYIAVHMPTGKVQEHADDFWNGDLFIWQLQTLRRLGWKIVWCRAYPLYLMRNL